MSVLIYNKTRDALVCVKQFRPAVYMSRHKELWENSPVFTSPLSLKSESPPTTNEPPSTQELPPTIEPAATTDAAATSAPGYASGALGCAYEMCAGIIDKGSSLEQITKEEILEETGYDVPLENIERVSSYYSGVGHSGSHQTFYYCEVADSMMVDGGGGNVQEGECIEVLYVPADQVLDLLFNEEVPKSATFCYALLWFYHFKRSKK